MPKSKAAQQYSSSAQLRRLMTGRPLNTLPIIVTPIYISPVDSSELVVVRSSLDCAIQTEIPKWL